MADFMF